MSGYLLIMDLSSEKADTKLEFSRAGCQKACLLEGTTGTPPLSKVCELNMYLATFLREVRLGGLGLWDQLQY